ncbi:MAG: GAF domain-containing protein, partial [Bacteroidota bacterium]
MAKTTVSGKKKISLNQQLAQREAELALINSVQEGLVAQLDFNAIIHLVGNRLYEIFKVSTVQINIYDPASDLLHTPYCFEEGNLHTHEAHTPSVLERPILDAKQTIVINENLLEIARQNGMERPAAGKLPRSAVGVPLLVKGELRGYISLQDNDHENTFTEPVVRLASTLANSMSVALENARLFDETQRLFKAEQERVAELQIINSIQQGLAAELDFQFIVDLVGDKLREVFRTKDFGIRWYDEKTNLVHFMYEYEHGKRLAIPSRPLDHAVS